MSSNFLRSVDSNLQWMGGRYSGGTIASGLALLPCPG
jgi:hypothetical protein